MGFFRNTAKNCYYKLIKILTSSDFYFKFNGFCVCCEQKVSFVSFNDWLRDNFYCNNCGSIPRERALMHVIESYYPGWKDLNIHESSPEPRGASLKLKKYCKNYISSQYYNDSEPGKIINGNFNENLEKQSFKNDYFDLVVTQDVMEHVLNPDKAFSEIARTLKPGGAHIFTVPLVNKHKPTEKWAQLDSDGKLEFLKEPEYHGNPIDPKGSPVTMHWGFDIIDYIKKSSGLNSEIVHLDDLNLGIRAEFIEVIVSQKDK